MHCIREPEIRTCSMCKKTRKTSNFQTLLLQPYSYPSCLKMPDMSWVSIRTGNTPKQCWMSQDEKAARGHFDSTEKKTHPSSLVFYDVWRPLHHWVLYWLLFLCVSQGVLSFFATINTTIASHQFSAGARQSPAHVDLCPIVSLVLSWSSLSSFQKCEIPSAPQICSIFTIDSPCLPCFCCSHSLQRLNEHVSKLFQRDQVLDWPTRYVHPLTPVDNRNEDCRNFPSHVFRRFPVWMRLARHLSPPLDVLFRLLSTQAKAKMEILRVSMNSTWEKSTFNGSIQVDFRRFQTLLECFKSIEQYILVRAHTHVCACMYVCLYVCLSACLPGCLSVCLFVCLYVCMYVRRYVCMYVRRYVCMYVCMYLSIYLSLSYLSIYLSIHLSIYLSISILLIYLSILSIYLTYLSILLIYLSYLSIYLTHLSI